MDLIHGFVLSESQLADQDDDIQPKREAG